MCATPSCAAVATKHFSKQQLFEELAWFMPAFASSVERLYGTGAAVLARSSQGMSSAPDLQALQQTPLWRSLSELYDYGMYGAVPKINGLGDGSLLDVELFLDGIDGLTLYLKEDDGGVPKLSKQTVVLARARELLDDGAPDERLPIAQLALLAQAQVDWVRGNSGLGSDGFVRIEDARRWLAGCPGFIPTGSKRAPGFNFARSIAKDLPIDVLRAIEERAGLAGMTPFEVLRAAFANEIARDEIYGSSARPFAGNERCAAA